MNRQNMSSDINVKSRKLFLLRDQKQEEGWINRQAFG